MLVEDMPVLNAVSEDVPLPPVLAMHRNDCLVRAYEHDLKDRFGPLLATLPYDHDPLQYILVDGEFRAVAVGHFRYGPYEIHDVVCDSPDMWDRREEISAAVMKENPGSVIQRFMGKPV